MGLNGIRISGMRMGVSSVPEVDGCCWDFLLFFRLSSDSGLICRVDLHIMSIFRRFFKMEVGVVTGQ